jgi:protein tyrosine phosphatase
MRYWYVSQMERAHRRYILTQGPLPHTTGHFWLMVWEQNCKAVLMLNRIIEKNQVISAIMRRIWSYIVV